MTEIRTGVGRAIDGGYEQFGFNVYDDLLGDTSYLGLVVFSLIGRKISREDEAMLDELSVASHVSEPRVWPIKVSWIVGAFGRALPGYVAGLIALDGDIVGGRVGEDAARALVELHDAVEGAGAGDEAMVAFIARQPKLYGFGVPVRAVDERLAAFRAALARRQYPAGKYWQLAERYWRVVKQVRGLEANLLSAIAAISLDLGLTPAQVVPMVVTLIQPTFLSNATEAAAQSPAVLRSLPPDAVRYVGPAPRDSPRMVAAKANSNG